MSADVKLVASMSPLLQQRWSSLEHYICHGELSDDSLACTLRYFLLPGGHDRMFHWRVALKQRRTEFRGDLNDKSGKYSKGAVARPGLDRFQTTYQWRGPNTAAC